MSIITLTTDYGWKDHFVGALKGKILSEYPEATIVDLSHDIDPFNTAEASYVIGAGYASFPEGTVHLIGVDAEMNKENRHVAIQWNGHYFVCADNGIMGLVMQKILPEKMVAINIHDRFPGAFTDLDVFVKVACHIAKGGTLNVVGKDITEIKQPTELQPVITADKNSLKGYVVYIDHFGNVVTNISAQMFAETAKGRNYEIILNERGRIGDRGNIRQIRTKYSDIATSNAYPVKNYEGTKLAIFNEAGFLEIAVFRSNPNTVGTASSLLGLGYRDVVTINFINP
ncbi:Cytosolic protein [Flavobacterium longum]|uniref:SAM hydrolase/SAM-dependent halogenase family protein n=1 Tax=Flavobacterium longum TaxID=1299340 RepID=UPI0039EC41EB